MIIAILTIFTLTNLVLYIFLGTLWNNIKFHDTDVTEEKSLRSITVVVPFRNESSNLPDLIRSLENQSYDKDFFEVVFVNDHSEDDLKIIYDALEQVSYKNRILNLPKDYEGKKHAVSYALASIQSEIILCTDADCIPGKNWLQIINEVYNDERIQFIAAPVQIKHENFFQYIQSIEFSGLIAFGGIGIEKNIPVMCNGANMSYRRKVFDEVSGYNGNDHIPTGDDEFLMRKVFQKYPDGLKFLKNRDVIIQTRAKINLSELLNQRIRWVSKWKLGNSFRTMLFAILFYIDSLIALAIFWFLFFKPDVGLFLLTSRILGAYYFLNEVSNFFYIKVKPFKLVFLILFYPIYIVLLGIASIFGVYKWKGRKYFVND